MYSTDQIVISRDQPCAKVLPSTYIVPDCAPETAFVSGSTDPVYITVYGYMASKFTVLGSALGQHSQLLPGQPQLSSTSVGFICSERSQSTGACLPKSKIVKKVQVAYFSFQVSSQEAEASTSHLDLINDVILSIVPDCNRTSNATEDDGERRMRRLQTVYTRGGRNYEDSLDTTCYPGCGCDPLRVYVSSCKISQCTETDRKPSELNGQSKAHFLVDPAAGSTIFISKEDFSTRAAYCDPTGDEDCMYFVGVTHDLPSVSAVFSVTARTPSDISLIPCDSREYPDRIRLHTTDHIAVGASMRSQQRFYELCSQTNPKSEMSMMMATGDYSSLDHGVNPVALTAGAVDTLIVEAEQCHGHTSFYACADDGKCSEVLPSLTSWGYFADRNRFCVHSWEKYGRDVCQHTPATTNRISLRLPQVSGNYFLMANGTGRFNLEVRTTLKGLDYSPTLTYSGIQDVDSSTLQVESLTGNTIGLTWRQAKVYLPGLTDTVFADAMSYKLYIFDDNQAALFTRRDNVAADSACGVDYLANTVPLDAVTIIANVPVSATQRGQNFMSYTVKGLRTSTAYRFAVVATCDSLCLSQVTKQQAALNTRLKLSCNGGSNECHPQSVAYLPVRTTTASTPDSGDNDHTDSQGSSSSTLQAAAVVFGIIVLVIICLVGIVAAGYWWHTQRVLSGLDGEDDNSTTAGVSRFFAFIVESFGEVVNSMGRAISNISNGINSNNNNGGGSFSGIRASRLPSSSQHAGMDESWGAGSSATNTGAASSSASYAPPSGSNKSSVGGFGSSILGSVQSLGASVKQTWTNNPSSSNRATAGEVGSQSYLPLQVLRNNASGAASNAVGNPMQANRSQFTLEAEDDDEVHVSL